MMPYLGQAQPWTGGRELKIVSGGIRGLISSTPLVEISNDPRRRSRRAAPFGIGRESGARTRLGTPSGGTPLSAARFAAMPGLVRARRLAVWNDTPNRGGSEFPVESVDGPRGEFAYPDRRHRPPSLTSPVGKPELERILGSHAAEHRAPPSASRPCPNLADFQAEGGAARSSESDRR